MTATRNDQKSLKSGLAEQGPSTHDSTPARYLDWYNIRRLHYALNRKPPAKRLAQLNNVMRNAA